MGDGVDYSDRFATDQIFVTYKEAHSWAKPIALAIGFELVISSIKKPSSIRHTVYFRCNRGERYRGVGRNLSIIARPITCTKYVGCKFLIKAIGNPLIGEWKINVQRGESGIHNHGFIVYNAGRRQVSGVSPAAKAHIRDLRTSQCKPANIKLSLSQRFPEDGTTIYHVYNEVRKQKLHDANGQSSMQ